MNERRNRTRAKNRTVAYIATGVVHAAIIGALFVNYSSKTTTIDAAYADKVDVVKATTVPESQIQDQQDKLKKIERDKKRKQNQQRKDLEKLKEQSELEKKRIDDLQKQQKVEKEKTAKLESERKAIALKKQQEEAKRKNELLEQKRKDELATKKKKQQEELNRIQREEQELEAQRRMNESIAAEESLIADRLAKQRATTLLGKYTALIKNKVNSERIISPDFERWRTATINVKLSPSGDVLSARTVKSSGSIRYDRSVETAIYQASPLPIPAEAEDPGVNRQFRNLNLIFDMTGV